jgi:imidazolonepropionase
VIAVLRNARVMTCDPAQPSLGVIDKGAVAIDAGRVAWVGVDAELPGVFAQADTVLDAHGALVTPGLVDCHTHAIFAGDRANEFAMRAAGKGYLEIAAAGGGINATLGPTRSATDDALLALLEARLLRALAGGTTTIEIKSGYDLTVDGELRLLRVIARAATRSRQRIVPTLLAHLIPPERKPTRDAFVAEVVEQLVPQVAAQKLATSVDVYCDEGAFTLAETTSILRAAHAAGLRVRGHVGQFADLGAASLLGDLRALSADHVEQIDDTGIAALAAAGTVAVMLPGACVQLRLPAPPVAKLRAAGIPLAIASDLNPGSSYCETLQIQMWLATTHYGMTVEEAWLGVTRNAARALAIDAGTITTNAVADLVVWNCDDPAHVPYRYGSNLIDAVIVRGEPIGIPRLD